MITRNNIEWGGRGGQLGHLYRHRLKINAANRSIMGSHAATIYLDVYSKREEPATNFNDLLYILPYGKEHGCYGKAYATPTKDIVGVKLSSSTAITYYYFNDPNSTYINEVTLQDDSMNAPIFVEDEVTMIF